MNWKKAAAAGATALALVVTAVPAQDDGARDTEQARKEMERAREEVEKAREELRKATRELARSMARIERDNPKVQYFEYMTNPKRAVLGIIIDDENPDQDPAGVRVLAVTPGTGAEAAGLEAGDLIVALNGRKLAGDKERSPHRALRDEMRKLEAGDEAKLEYLRDGKRRTAKVVTQAPHPDLAIAAIPPLPPVAPLPPGAWDEDFEKMMPMAKMFQFRGPVIRGLELAKLDEDLGWYFKSNEGVLVVKAPRAGGLGLKSGDVIQKIDGDKVAEPVTVLDKLRSRGQEYAVKLDVLRQGRKVEIEGKIPSMRSERPAAEHGSGKP